MSFGKGGSMHIFTPCFYGGNGIVGAQVSFSQQGIAYKTHKLMFDRSQSARVLH